MTNTALLITVIVVQQGLIGSAWTVAALTGISRRAACHWAAATGLTVCSFVLVGQRGGVDPWLGYGLANLLGLAAGVLVRRGVQVFCRAAPSDREHAATLAVAAAALALVLASGAPPAWNVFFTSAAAAWVLLRCAAELWQRLRFEFGPRAAVVLALPMVLLGSAYVLRALLAPFAGAGLGDPATTATVANARFGLFMVGALLLLHFSLGGMAAVRLVKKLEHLSLHDPLTGVLNRRGLESRLDGEAQRLARYGTPFALLAIDLDHFKRVNDLHGHAAGDTALQSVARALETALREVDCIGRVGGEEFYALLPASDETAARAAAARLLERVRTLPPLTGDAGSVTQLTVSIGIAVATDRRESRHELLRRLDAALYRAKDEGRDRAVAAVPAVSGLRLAAD